MAEDRRSTFEELNWEPSPDTSVRLVDAPDPDGMTGHPNISHRLEAADRRRGEPGPTGELTVVAWNVERGFKLDGQRELLQAPPFPAPDVLLLSECDRGCARTDHRNVTAELSDAIGGCYVFATEFLELPVERPAGVPPPWDPPACEHGNAVVSRRPLGNAQPLRFTEQVDWYRPPGDPFPEPRIGGRIALGADVLVQTPSGPRVVRAWSVHLESMATDIDLQVAQAEQIAAVAAEEAAHGTPVVIGGDLNAFFALHDLTHGTTNDRTAKAFLDAGLTDALADVDPTRRATTHRPVEAMLDFLFVANVDVVAAGVADCADLDLSDHLPIWATLRIPTV